MADSKGDQLRDLLSRQVRAASDQAVEAGGQVSAEQVEALERLARLVEISDAAQPPPRNRWPVAALLGCTLLIVSVLLFARVPETEIELDLAVSEVGFVLPTQQVLAEVMRLSSLGVSGLEGVRLPPARGRAAQTLDGSEDVGSAIRLSVASDGERRGTVSLATLTLPGGTRVRVSHTDVPHQYRLSLEGARLDLRAGVNGPVQVGMSGVRAERFDFKSPKSVLLWTDSNQIVPTDLDLTFLGPSKGTFSPQLSANDLSLFRIDKFVETEGTVIRQVSTVLSGTLYLESLNGEERPLRPGEWIHFGQSQGEIRTLRLHDDHIALKFHGRVRGMSTGSGKSRRSLMPTTLEWLRARHGLSLFWGTTLYLFSLIVAALRWWRIPV